MTDYSFHLVNPLLNETLDLNKRNKQGKTALDIG
jgi:hypothetical protein